MGAYRFVPDLVYRALYIRTYPLESSQICRQPLLLRLLDDSQHTRTYSRLYDAFQPGDVLYDYTGNELYDSDLSHNFRNRRRYIGVYPPIRNVTDCKSRRRFPSAFTAYAFAIEQTGAKICLNYLKK